MWQPSKKIIAEVKKTSGGEWIFLAEKNSKSKTHNVITLSSSHSEDEELNSIEWASSVIDYYTVRSAFCIVSGQDENNPMLERLCTNILMATEAFAIRYSKSNLNTSTYLNTTTYIPVIITNTPMYLCSYEPIEVDLKSGKLTIEPEINEINSVAFQKPFWSSIKNRNMNNYSSEYIFNEAQDRTVLIVNTTAFSEFLKDLDPRAL